MVTTPKTVYCPRCDRPFAAPTRIAALFKMRQHVKKAHPEYDPQWEEL